ncbi:MAG: T9SS type A sorting domain-containing protein [Salinivenus sp.]
MNRWITPLFLLLVLGLVSPPDTVQAKDPSALVAEALVQNAGTGALPVELTGVEAVRSGSAVELAWQTASETNNAGFRVQHQAEEGGSWTELGVVDSKASDGTTTKAQSYRFDVSEDLEPGTHRFRLEQADLDGSTTLSDVVSVEVGMDEVLSLSAPAPNPASGQTSVSFGVKRSVETTVAVHNVLGQRVKTLYEGTPAAEQTRETTFDAGSLPSGMYFVRMEADGQTETQRLTVVQ